MLPGVIRSALYGLCTVLDGHRIAWRVCWGWVVRLLSFVRVALPRRRIGITKFALLVAAKGKADLLTLDRPPGDRLECRLVG